MNGKHRVEQALARYLHLSSGHWVHPGWFEAPGAPAPTGSLLNASTSRGGGRPAVTSTSLASCRGQIVAHADGQATCTEEIAGRGCQGLGQRHERGQVACIVVIDDDYCPICGAGASYP